MKLIKIITVIFILSTSVFSNEISKRIDEAEEKFKNGEVQQGKVILDDLSNIENLSNEEKANINNKIAWFQLELVGNYEYAMRFSNNVLKLSLAENHPAVIEANKRIEKIKKYKLTYRNEILMLRRIRIGAPSEEVAEKNIKQLETLIENNPNFPSLPTAQHYLGKNYLYLGKYYKSKKIFAEVLEKKPGIIFLLPTKSLLTTAENKWNNFFINTYTIIIISMSLILLLLLLYYSKFWNWFNLKSLITLPAIIALWGIFILFISWLLHSFIPDQKHLFLPDPQFIQAHPFSPGSEKLIAIFYYGILGIIYSFLLSLATQGIFKVKISIAVNSIILVLFCSAIFGVFYQQKCYQKSIFEKRENSSLPVLTGHIYFQELDYEPLILTNPRKYMNLTLDNTNDKYFVKWIEKQYSIITNKRMNNEDKNSKVKK